MSIHVTTNHVITEDSVATRNRHRDWWCFRKRRQSSLPAAGRRSVCKRWCLCTLEENSAAISHASHPFAIRQVDMCKTLPSSLLLPQSAGLCLYIKHNGLDGIHQPLQILDLELGPVNLHAPLRLLPHFIRLVVYLRGIAFRIVTPAGAAGS